MGKATLITKGKGKIGECIGILLILLGTWGLLGAAQHGTPLPEGAVGRFGLGRLFDLEFSPNGRYLAMGALFGIELRDSQTFRLIRFLPLASPATTISFSPNGRILAAASREGTVILWDTRTWQILHTLEGHTKPVPALTFSPDGTLLATGSYDKTIRLWDVAKGTLLKALEGHTGRIAGISFSPDGRLLASQGKDRTVRIWEVASGKILRTIKIGFSVAEPPIFSQDGKVLFIGQEKEIGAWSVETGEQIYSLEGHTDDVSVLALSPDGHLLASGGFDNTVRLWDLSDHRLLHTIEEGAWIASLSFSPDGAILAAGTGDERVILWSLDPCRRLRSFTEHASMVETLSFSPDGRVLAAGYSGGAVRLWEVGSGRMQHYLRSQTDRIVGTAFSPDGRFLAIAPWMEDNEIAIFYADRPWGLPHAIMQHSSPQEATRHIPVSSISFSPDGKWFASAGVGSINLWSAKWEYIPPATWVRTSRTFEGPDRLDSLASIAFSSSGRLLAAGAKSGKGEGTIWIWDVSDGSLLRSFQGHSDGVTSIAFSPKEDILASGSFDKTVKLWNAQTGALLHTLEHHSSVYAVSFSPDGELLASVSWGFLNLWDPSSGQLLASVEIPGISTTTFDRSGRFIATGGWDGTVLIWDVQSLLQQR